MKKIKTQKTMAKAQGKGKPVKPITGIVSQALSGEVFPLVITRVEGELIVGTFSVERTATEDILTGTITDWKGNWWDYHFNHAFEPFQMVAGGAGATNYNNTPNPAYPFIFSATVPHGGVEGRYFFGVSSAEGFNVAGKTLIVN